MFGAKKNVLIIEHEAIIALDIKKRFEKEGHNVVGISSSFRETLGNIRNYKNVDLILLDSGLSDFNHRMPLAEKIYSFFNTPLILLVSNIDSNFR